MFSNFKCFIQDPWAFGSACTCSKHICGYCFNCLFEITPFVAVLFSNSAETVRGGARVCGSNLGVPNVRDTKMQFAFPCLSTLSMILRWVANSCWPVIPSWMPLKTPQEVMQECQCHNMSIWSIVFFVQLSALYHIQWWMFLWGKYVSTTQ